MATHAPITGAPTRAPFIPAPPAAITRVLSRFDRDQLASFIVVAIDLLDVAAGDPDLEDGHDAEGSTWGQSGPRVNGANLSDDHEEAGDEGDASVPEWAGRPARFRHGNAALGHEDAEEDDEAEDDDPDQCLAGDDGCAPIMTDGGTVWGAPADDSDAEPWDVRANWSIAHVPANDARVLA